MAYSFSATCVLCRGKADFDPEGDKIKVHWGRCQFCGRYEVTFEATRLLIRLDALDQVRVSAFARQETDAGGVARIDDKNLSDIVEEMRARPVAEKIRRALRALGDLTKVAGDSIEFSPGNANRAILQRQAGAVTDNELQFVMTALVEGGELALTLNHGKID
jgi:hypothetical protein